MKWSKRSPYSIQAGEWIICRTVHSGRDMFTLWRGMESVGDYGTAAAAKRAAEQYKGVA